MTTRKQRSSSTPRPRRVPLTPTLSPQAGRGSAPALAQLLLWPRLRLRLLGRKVCALPAVGAVGVPGDVGVTVGQGALGGVPGHPAIRQAIDHEQRSLVAARGAGEAAL